MSKIITDPQAIAMLSKVNVDLNQNTIVLQSDVPIFIHKADPSQFIYSVIRIARGQVIGTAYDENIVRFLETLSYGYYSDDDPYSDECNDKRFEDEMDPSFRVYYDDTQELLNAREKTVQRVEDPPESERLFIPETDTSDKNRPMANKSFEDTVKAVKKLTYFNSLTGCEEYTIINSNGTEYELEGDPAPYAHLIDPVEIPECPYGPDYDPS